MSGDLQRDWRFRTGRCVWYVMDMVSGSLLLLKQAVLQRRNRFPGNGQGYNNPEVDKCLENALLTTDQNERADLYKKALALIVKDMPGIFYANENVEWGVTPNVQGLVQRADGKVKICTTDINVWLSK